MQCESDHSMFVKHYSEDRISVTIIYSDDIIITGNHEEEITRIKLLLSKKFEKKDLGHLKYFLGVEAARWPRSKHGILISQRKYVLDLLKETWMLRVQACRYFNGPKYKNWNGRESTS